MCKNMQETWMALDDMPEFHKIFFLEIWNSRTTCSDER